MANIQAASIRLYLAENAIRELVATGVETYPEELMNNLSAAEDNFSEVLAIHAQKYWLNFRELPKDVIKDHISELILHFGRDCVPAGPEMPYNPIEWGIYIGILIGNTIEMAIAY